jgi:hypothetical protein
MTQALAVAGQLAAAAIVIAVLWVCTGLAIIGARTIGYRRHRAPRSPR